MRPICHPAADRPLTVGPPPPGSRSTGPTASGHLRQPGGAHRAFGVTSRAGRAASAALNSENVWFT